MYLYIKLILIYFLILKIHLLTKFICSSKSIIIALSVFKSSSCSTCANSQLRTNKAMTILLILVWPQDEDRKRKGQCGARSSDSDTVSEVASGESLWTSLCLLYNRLPGWVAFRIEGYNLCGLYIFPLGEMLQYLLNRCSLRLYRTYYEEWELSICVCARTLIAGLNGGTQEICSYSKYWNLIWKKGLCTCDRVKMTSS